jgi:PBP1b-binding outer membrane lipoprotein LpoB
MDKGDSPMKKIASTLLAGAFMLSGCASFEEAYTLDREFGQASQMAWQQQIANPERRIETPPEGMEGIIAEKAMGVHIDTYDDKPTKMDVFSIGIMGK